MLTSRGHRCRSGASGRRSVDASWMVAGDEVVPQVAMTPLLVPHA